MRCFDIVGVLLLALIGRDTLAQALQRYSALLLTAITKLVVSSRVMAKIKDI